MTDADTLEAPAPPSPAAVAGPTVSEQSAQIVDGIYFELPMEVYLAVPRLGAGHLSDLNVSPGTFWRGSWLDPDRDDPDEEESKAFVLGRAYHCARLEPDALEKRYCRKMCREDFAEAAKKQGGAAWTGKDIEAELAKLEQPKKHKDDRGVADQAKRLEEAGYKGIIWPLEEARFNAQLGGRQPIEAKYWDKVVRDMERIHASEVGKYLTGGSAEVSVFWTDANNIQRKARFDYLTPSHWADFKTFDNSRGKRLEQAIADAIRFNRYYVTAASYREAAEAVRTGGLTIIGKASEGERDLVARLQLTAIELDCWFIFQEKNGVPNLLAKQFVFFDIPEQTKLNEFGATDEQKAVGRAATRRPTQIFAKAITEIDYAKRLFVLYSEVYEPGRPWSPLEPVSRISDLDFNSNWLEGKYE